MLVDIRQFRPGTVFLNNTSISMDLLNQSLKLPTGKQSGFYGDAKDVLDV